MKNLSKVCLNGMECDTIHKFSLPLQALVLAATMLGYVKLCWTRNLTSVRVKETAIQNFAKFSTDDPSSRLEKKPTINSWARHALCDSVFSNERNRWRFGEMVDLQR